MNSQYLRNSLLLLKNQQKPCKYYFIWLAYKEYSFCC